MLSLTDSIRRKRWRDACHTPVHIRSTAHPCRWSFACFEKVTPTVMGKQRCFLSITLIINKCRFISVSRELETIGSGQEGEASNFQSVTMKTLEGVWVERKFITARASAISQNTKTFR